MPSEKVIDKAAKLLKGNQVIFSAVGHRYDVGIGDGAYTVHVGEDIDGDRYYSCTCRYGQEHGVINDIDKACSHMLAADTLDNGLRKRARRMQT